MRRPTAVVLALGIAATTAAAFFAGSVISASGAKPSDPDRQHSVARPNLAPHAATDTATELKFTAIAPCRAIDTRHAGGDLLSDHTRTFKVGGTGFTAQGGPSSGCGLPTNVTAIAATVTTVARHPGYLKAWAAGAPQPATSFMNYGTSFNASTGGTIPVGSGAQITILNHGGPTDVIVDITGYYMKPMFAGVNANGTLNKASRTTNSIHLGNGVYEVDFDRDVSGCSYAATPFLPGLILVEPRSTNLNGVYVETLNASQTDADTRFYLTVTC